MVLGSEVATEVYAQQDSRKWAGVFGVGAEVKDGHTTDEVEKGLYQVLEKLKEEPVPAQELQKVKNNFAAYEYRKLSANHPILMQLISNEGLGDWREINEAGAKVQAVTAQEVQRVAKTYLTRENRTVGVYTRKGGATPEDPELKGLTGEQRSALQMISARLKEEKDVKKLKEGLARLEAQAGKAEKEDKAFLEIYKRRVEKRISELQPK
jgi:hypothetical protein